MFLVLRAHNDRLLKSLKALFELLTDQLQLTDSPVAPYVASVLNCLVKFFVGEEYRLGSDLVAAAAS